MPMWLAVGECVRGIQHEKVGLPCQDYCETRVVGARTFIALADGAGSAKYSQQGSVIAVRTVLDEATKCTVPLREISEDQAIVWLKSVRDEIDKTATASKAKPGDYAATLLLCILEGNAGYFWQIGDGAWVVETDKCVEVAMWPMNGQYINETFFVTSENAPFEWVHAFFPDVRCVLGFSDGIEHLCLDFAAKKPHAPFVGKMFGYLKSSPPKDATAQQVSNLLRSEFLNERTDDDKTLVVAWRAVDDAAH